MPPLKMSIHIGNYREYERNLKSKINREITFYYLQFPELYDPFFIFHAAYKDNKV